jgi:hypothetical protein
MQSHPRSVTTTLISLVTLGASEALAAAELPQSPDSLYFTLGERADAEGPVYSPAAGKSDAFKYVDDLTSLILSEADRLGSFWLDEGNDEAYVSFLMGALTVPLHESGLQHFRKLDHERGRCSEGMNAGAVLRKAGQRAIALFSKVAKSGTAPIVPDCTTFKAADPALQLVGSSDALSTGLMQINYLAHPDYLPNGDFLNVLKTVRTGLTQYLKGFKALVERPDEFTCVRGAHAGEINYANVIRGAWAGAYNSGNVAQSCRFAEASKWSQDNDAPFARDLKSVRDSSRGFYAEHLSDSGAGAYRKIAGSFSSFGDGFSSNAILMDATVIHHDISGTTRPTASAPTEDSAKPVPGVVRIAPGMRVNVRARPSTAAPVQTSLRNGASVVVYGRFRAAAERAGWLAITPAQDRWVSSRFVRKAQ